MAGSEGGLGVIAGAIGVRERVAGAGAARVGLRALVCGQADAGGAGGVVVGRAARAPSGDAGCGERLEAREGGG